MLEIKSKKYQTTQYIIVFITFIYLTWLYELIEKRTVRAILLH